MGRKRNLLCLLTVFLSLPLSASENKESATEKKPDPHLWEPIRGGTWRPLIGFSHYNIVADKESEALKKNQISSFSLILITPWLPDQALRSAAALHLQYARYSHEIELPDKGSNSESLFVSNFRAVTISTDYRLSFPVDSGFWKFAAFAGAGIQIPIGGRVFSPRGELDFNDAAFYYPSSGDEIKKFTPPTAFYLMLGIEDTFLDDHLLWGTGLSLALFQSPQVKQGFKWHIMVAVPLW